MQKNEMEKTIEHGDLEPALRHTFISLAEFYQVLGTGGLRPVLCHPTSNNLVPIGILHVQGNPEGYLNPKP